MDFKQIKLFDDKTFEDLIKDIYVSHGKTKTQIDDLIELISKWAVDAESITMLLPIVEDYVGTSIKNDKYLIDLGTLVQKMLSSENSGKTNTNDIPVTLSSAEKKDLEARISQIKSDMGQNAITN